MTCHTVARPDEETLPAVRTVAVVGPPNSGKTTLFNRLTGLRQKVGNFPGVTVEHHTGHIRDAVGNEIALIDLPGVYSLNPEVGRRKGCGRRAAGQTCPASDVRSRHSGAEFQQPPAATWCWPARVIALGLPTLVLLNMADELREQGGHVDVLSLARQLGTPVALVSAVTGEGLFAVVIFFRPRRRFLSRWSCRLSATPAVPANGPYGSARMRSIVARQRRFGPAAWMASSFIASGER